VGKLGAEDYLEVVVKEVILVLEALMVVLVQMETQLTMVTEEKMDLSLFN
jgi:hypothetical protein